MLYVVFVVCVCCCVFVVDVCWCLVSVLCCVRVVRLFVYGRFLCVVVFVNVDVSWCCLLFVVGCCELLLVAIR